MLPLLPHPKTVLRISGLACLIGAVTLSLISRGSPGLAHELARFLPAGAQESLTGVTVNGGAEYSVV